MYAIRSLVLCLLAADALAFAPACGQQHRHHATASLTAPSAFTTTLTISDQSGTALYATDDGSQSTETVTTEASETSVSVEKVSTPTQATATSAIPSQSEPESKYPINVPSPLLLGSSMILAISGTGSLFELLGGDPKLGFGPSVAIAAIGLPSCLYLFYASILKAQAETEEDDKAFRSGRK